MIEIIDLPANYRIRYVGISIHLPDFEGIPVNYAYASPCLVRLVCCYQVVTRPKVSP